jgi:hypothetical protein
MLEEPKGAEKKIFVDEDWKSQVAAEKEAMRHPQESPQADVPPQNPAAADEDLPPASLSLLANSLYLQAAIALGLLPNPISGKSEASLPHAQHTIDMLGVLQEKTAGNRTPEESEDIEAMLHQLRMVYVSIRERHGKTA